MNDSQAIAVVTGANRGIGLETCRLLAKRQVCVMLTARDAKNDSKAVQQLSSEGLTVHFEKLDITNGDDRERLRQIVAVRFGRLDVLINNAGVGSTEDNNILDVSIRALSLTLETNCLSSLALCQTFLPLLKAARMPRIINVSSGMGALSMMRGDLAAYRLSKTCLNATTIMLSESLRAAGILVAAVCPGWTRTRMGGPGAPRSAQEAAETIVWAALDAGTEIHGRFLRDRQAIAW